MCDLISSHTKSQSLVARISLDLLDYKRRLLMESSIASDSKDSPICIRNTNGNANDGALLRIKRRRCDLSTDEISGLTH